MRPLLIVVIDPVSDPVVCLIEGLEDLLPDALLLEAPEESLDHSVLFRGIRCDVLLGQLVPRYRLMESFRAEHKAVVRSDHQWLPAGQDLLANQCVFQRSRRDAGLPGLRKPPSDQVSVTAIDDGDKMAPTVLLCEQMRHVDRPTAVDLCGNALEALDPRAVPIRMLPTLPATFLDDPMDLLSVEGNPMTPTEHRGDPSRPVLRKRLDYLSDLLDQPYIGFCLPFGLSL